MVGHVDRNIDGRTDRRVDSGRAKKLIKWINERSAILVQASHITTRLNAHVVCHKARATLRHLRQRCLLMSRLKAMVESGWWLGLSRVKFLRISSIFFNSPLHWRFWSDRVPLSQVNICIITNGYDAELCAGRVNQRAGYTLDMTLRI